MKEMMSPLKGVGLKEVRQHLMGGDTNDPVSSC